MRIHLATSAMIILCGLSVSCSTVSLDYSGIEHPIVLGTRLHAGGGGELEARRAGPEYKASASRVSGAAVGLNGSTQATVQKSDLAAEAQRLLGGGKRRAIRNAVVSPENGILYLLVAVANATVVGVKGDVVRVAPGPAPSDPEPSE